MIFAQVVVALILTSPVASVQFDLSTTGTVTMVPSITDKTMATNKLPDGKTRVIIYGLNQSTFTGKFAQVSAPVTTITGVVGANPDGTTAVVEIKKLTPPLNLRLAIAKQ